jgi:hypothetical protein
MPRHGGGCFVLRLTTDFVHAYGFGPRDNLRPLRAPTAAADTIHSYLLLWEGDRRTPLFTNSLSSRYSGVSSVAPVFDVVGYCASASDWLFDNQLEGCRWEIFTGIPIRICVLSTLLSVAAKLSTGVFATLLLNFRLFAFFLALYFFEFGGGKRDLLVFDPTLKSPDFLRDFMCVALREFLIDRDFFLCW